jgi:high-affinity iron transporter
MSIISHEFEEVIGETPKIYNFGVVVESEDEEAAEAEEGAAEDAVASPEYTGWSEKRLPMAVFKPFGYSAGPTQLMTACFWVWLVFGFILHAWKYMSSKKIREAEERANAEKIAAKNLNGPMDTEESADMDEFLKIIHGGEPMKKDEASTDEENNSR